jgi:hypothetical protein
MKYAKNVTGCYGNNIITSSCLFIYNASVNKIKVFSSINELRTINS